MTALVLTLLLSQSTVAGDAPQTAPGEAAAAESTDVATQPARPPEPWYKTLPNNPWFGRAFSAAVLATGVTLLLVGTAAFGAMLALRTTSVLDNTRKEYKDNGVGLTTLTAATGLLLGAALTLGGVVGIILL